MERRFWYGVGILAFFLVLGLWTARSIQTAQQPVAGKLEQAARAALEGDMEESVTLVRDAKGVWQQNRTLTAAVADHGPMEEIDSLFAQVEVYACTENAADFAAYCSRIAKLVEAVGEAHGLNWKNLL